LPLTQLLGLLRPEIECFSLQKDIGASDARLLNRHAIGHFGQQLTSFAETAALIMQLDIVISVDTAVAHLAGALGKPTWLLLPHNADFRWLIGRRDSPWYPSMRLFRQPAIGDWPGVMRAVAQQLEYRLQGLVMG
jgi:ADP-heptose:LPS heptosyltransferase